jgi:hypothetical protein
VPNAPSLPSNDEWAEEWAGRRRCTCFYRWRGTYWPTGFWFGGRPSLLPDEPSVGRAARSRDSWSVNRHFLWRLLQPPNHLAAGSRALRLRHYRRFKRRLQGLPPFEAAVGSCRQFNRRFEATFDKVWNDYLFSENHRKLKITKILNKFLVV